MQAIISEFTVTTCIWFVIFVVIIIQQILLIILFYFKIEFVEYYYIHDKAMVCIDYNMLYLSSTKFRAKQIIDNNSGESPAILKTRTKGGSNYMSPFKCIDPQKEKGFQPLEPPSGSAPAI